MKYLTVMLKPASSLCNLRCQYCFYADVSSLRQVRSYGIMTRETAQAVIRNVFSSLEPGDQVTFSFQGGEPTLAGLDFYKDFAAMAKELSALRFSVRYTLQTNGILLDDAWCAFLKENRFLVGLSLDGPAKYHDANRVDSLEKGTFQKVMSTKRLLEKYAVEYNILTVLTRELARHPKQVWQFLVEQDIRFVQFIPCLGALEQGEDPYALTPQRYARFYTQLFQLWLEHYSRGKYISVKLFDDLVNLLSFGQCNACGLLGACHSQVIVEADGSVYPCDFYVLDEYRAGNLRAQTLQQILDAPAMEAFRTRTRREQPLCAECPYYKMCRGGCARMTDAVFFDPRRSLCGHRLFLERCYPQLQQLALLQRRRG